MPIYVNNIKYILENKFAHDHLVSKMVLITAVSRISKDLPSSLAALEQICTQMITEYLYRNEKGKCILTAIFFQYL